MGRRLVRRLKVKATAPAPASDEGNKVSMMAGLVGGYGSDSDDAESQEDEAAAPAAPAPVWDKQIDEATGAAYWWNRTTNETTWNDPSPAPAAAPAAADDTDAASSTAGRSESELSAPELAALRPLVPLFVGVEAQLATYA